MQLLRCQRQAHSIRKHPAPVNLSDRHGTPVDAIKELLCPISYITIAPARQRPRRLRRKCSRRAQWDPSRSAARSSTIKPPRELYAEILLELGRTEEAATQFEDMLVRMPNRTQSILGAARAAARLGDRATAAKQYKVLLSIWDETSMSAARDEAVSYLSASESS